MVVEPVLGLVLLARGTGPVLTGVVAVLVRAAGLTVIDLAAAASPCGTAQCPAWPAGDGKQPVTELRAVLGAMDAENVRDLHHHRSPLRRLMASAPRCAALAVRCVSTLRGGGSAVPERRLHEPELDASLQPMGAPRHAAACGPTRVCGGHWR